MSIYRPYTPAVGRERNRPRCCPIENLSDSDDCPNCCDPCTIRPLRGDPSRKAIVQKQCCGPTPKYNKQACVGGSCYIYTAVASTMGINDSHLNTMRINLKSPVFDSNFDSKLISQVGLIRNYDGSVDFVLKFDGTGINTLINNYPPNPIYPPLKLTTI